MDLDTKRIRIANYFKRYPRWAIIFITISFVIALVGFISMIIGIANGDLNDILLGLVILIIGGILFLMSILLGAAMAARQIGVNRKILKGVGKPTDQEMDQYIEEDLRMTKKKSLQKGAVDDSELITDSIIIPTIRLWNTGGAKFLYKKGKDGKFRFTPINVNILHMLQNQLVIYEGCLDLLTGNLVNENVTEFFYKDIVTVSKQTVSKSSKDLGKFGSFKFKNAEVLAFVTAGGTKHVIFLRDQKKLKKMDGSYIPTTEVEKAIQAITRMIRDKKQN